MALKGRIAIGFERTLFKRFCLQDRVSGSGRLITLRIGSSTYACTTSNSQQPTAHRIFLKKSYSARNVKKRTVYRSTYVSSRKDSLYINRIGNTYTTTVRAEGCFRDFKNRSRRTVENNASCACAITKCSLRCALVC